jgi:hypothetical protein
MMITTLIPEIRISNPVLYCRRILFFTEGKNEEFKIREATNTNFPDVVLGNLSFLPISRAANRLSSGIFTELSRETFPRCPLKQWPQVGFRTSGNIVKLLIFFQSLLFFFLISC